MCSIIAYKGNNKASSIIVDALRKMEYRGYDSVGIATLADNNILVKKGIGKVDEVNAKLNLASLDGNIGIGHTRWATHGAVTDYNAHPHKACNDIAIVHNGKIDNYQQLRELLKDHKFNSQTDSEVIAHLLEENLKHKALKEAVIDTCKALKGSYAFVAMINDKIVGARRDEPLIIGISNNEYYLSSDILAFIEYTDNAIFLDNNEIVIIDDKLSIYDINGNNIKKDVTQIAWEFADINKGKYAHYTLKEIHEQLDTIPRVFNYNYNLDDFINAIKDANKLTIVASGSSYNASLLAKMLFKVNCEVIIASECKYYKDMLDDTVLAVSQSGETRDVLRAVNYAKENNAKILSIVNVKTSSLARISDISLSLNCGPEIGVAATKSFTAQLALFYRIADAINNKDYTYKITDAVKQALSIKLDDIIDDIKDKNDIYLLGRSIHYPIALEGALKIKELAYIHAEGMPAGEFRHGPLALVDKNTVVIMINPSDQTFDDTYSNLKEIKAREAKIIGISDKELDYDYSIKLPKVDDRLYPLIEVIPLQLLAYNLALKKNYNPDYPRNLAKSVTVD
ncbi:MAG: glutamine--fructose-6-phosphate aminotransferase [Candidatus Nitrosocaldaceae archaeon]|nr:MAG: glutamine--fructose-6-phosphate aminotransferase [Candidatus Nitrosocaldaceae archaeon]